MRSGRAFCSALAVGLSLALSTALSRAEPEPCSPRATLSPCFDAEALWLAPGPGPFAAVPSARALPSGATALLAGLAYLDRPVTLVAPSPHPAGRLVPVMRSTTTLTLALRRGLGRSVDAWLAVPVVPHQSGTGTEGVTAQRGEPLAGAALRDPRLGLMSALVGRRPGGALAVASRLEATLPVGSTGALASAGGPTVAPGLAGELSLGRVLLGLDLSLRLRRAVTFATVREGSTAVFTAGASVELTREPTLSLALEGSLRPGLAAPPPGAPPDARDLPAEWLSSLRYRPRPPAAWALELGGGSGLPLSRAHTGEGTAARLGVTAPRFRLLLAFRYALDSTSPNGAD